MNVADIVILSVIGISALLSLIRGLVKEVLSLLAWVVAFWLAFSFSSPLGERLSGVITQAPARIAIAFIGLLVGSLIIFGVLNSLIGRLLASSGLGDTDKFLGMLFGALRGVAIVLALVLLAGLTPLPSESWWRSSFFLPQLAVLAHWIIGWLLPEFAGHFGYDAGPVGR